MYKPAISKLKRFSACVMGLMMFLVVLFSALFILHESAHECTGEDCPVCACIAQCENTLSQIGEGSACRIAIALPAIFFLLMAFLFVSYPRLETLISRKVRLNN